MTDLEYLVQRLPRFREVVALQVTPRQTHPALDLPLVALLLNGSPHGMRIGVFRVYFQNLLQFFERQRNLVLFHASSGRFQKLPNLLLPRGLIDLQTEQRDLRVNMPFRLELNEDLGSELAVAFRKCFLSALNPWLNLRRIEAIDRLIVVRLLQYVPEVARAREAMYGRLGHGLVDDHADDLRNRRIDFRDGRRNAPPHRLGRFRWSFASERLAARQCFVTHYAQREDVRNR